MRLPLLFVGLAIAACGDDAAPNQFPDASPDAPTNEDAGQDAPTAGVVTITVTNGAQPFENAAVYFQSADSTLIAMALTDVNGRASQVMEPGGFVTAVNPFNGAGLRGLQSQSLSTYAGVKPGDQLVLTNPYVGTSNSFTISGTGVASANGYRVFSSGSSTLGYQSATSLDGAPLSYRRPAPYDLLITTNDGTGVSDQFTTHLGVSPTAGMLDLTTSWQDITQHTWSLANVPAAFTGYQGRYYLASPRGMLFEAALPFGTVDVGASSVTSLAPAVSNTTGVFVATFDQVDVSRTEVMNWKPSAASQTFDYANAAVAHFTVAPAVDRATRTVTWTESAGTPAESTLITLIAIDAQNMSWQWSLCAPHGGASVVFPTLPTGAASYDLGTATDAFVNDLRVLKTPGGYDAVRPFLLSALQHPLNAVASAQGQATIVQYVGQR